MAGPLISLLTDFGARDPSAAICRGVIWGIAPEARLLDISHEVTKYAIRDGALLLWCALPYLPIGVHAAVVDPGVGTDRRPIAIRTVRGDHLVGPDNGLLLPGADRLGGVEAAIELTNPAFRLPVVSSSFHGRDIFSPAAAHLALGVPIGDLGPSIEPSTLVTLGIPEPVVDRGRLATSIVYVDTFGNVKLSALIEDLEAALGPLSPGDPLRLEIASHGQAAGSTLRVPWQDAFGHAGEGQPLLYQDSYGRVCLAIDRGNAGTQLGLVDDQPVLVSRDATTGG
jgi:S-adenosylmethionine hydrolase